MLQTCAVESHTDIMLRSMQGSSSRVHPSRGRSRLDVQCARKVSSGKQVACSKTLVCKPGHEQQVAALVAGITQFSLDRAKAREGGIVVFESMRDAWEPNTFHTWERYDSNVAMGKHNTTEQYKRFMEQVNTHLERPVAMILYEWKDGRLGPACLGEGPKGEGGLDDATGASGAAGGASLKQTSTAFNLSAHKDPIMEDDPLAASFKEAKKQMESAGLGLNKLLGNFFGGNKAKEGKEDKQPAGRK